MSVIRISVVADSRKAVSEMRRTGDEVKKLGADVDRIGARMGSGLASAAKVGFAALAVGAGALVVGLGKSTQAASEMSDTVDATRIVFGDASAAVEKFASDAAGSLGLSKQAALDASQTFGTLGKVAGLQGPALSKFSNDLTQLGGDMAALKGGTAASAVEAIGAALRGESEPIRRYGIILDEASVKAEALSMGLIKGSADVTKVKSAQVGLLTAQANLNKINAGGAVDATKLKQAQLGVMGAQESLNKVNADGKATATDKEQATLRLQIAQEKLAKVSKVGAIDEDARAVALAKVAAAQSKLTAATKGKIGALTQEQKVLATQSLILKQGSDSAGNFLDTIGSAKGQQEKFKASSANLSAELGKALLPAMGALYKVANDKLIPVFQGLVAKHGPALERIFTKLGNAVGDFVTAHADDLDAFFDKMANWIVGLDFSGVGEFFANLGKGSSEAAPALRELGPALRELLNGFKGLAGDTLTVAGVAVRFFAEHVDLLVKAMPYLLTALVAWKAAQAAGNVAALANLPIQAGQVISNLALAVANRSLATAIASSSLAITTNTTASKANRLATVAKTVTDVAAGTASRVAAAGQWILNASLLGCPIVWIILGIAAIIAIVVLMVKHWDKVTAALGWFWDKIKLGFKWLRDNWPLVLAILAGPLALAVLAITKHWDAIAAFFTGAPARIAAACKGMWAPLGDSFKAAINFIIKAWNDLKFEIPAVETKIPGVGKIGGFSLETPNMRMMASGGIVTGPTLALLGEAGPEAVIPLDRLSGGTIVNVYVTVSPLANPADVGREVKRAIEAYDRLSGTRSLLA